MKKNIRNAAKALIVKDDKILLIKYKRNKVYYTLPGGGQQHNEELSEALRRECLEELGAAINIKDIAFVFEYIAERHENTILKEGFHQLDIVFECELTSDINYYDAYEHDETQIGYEWLSLSILRNVEMYPLDLRQHIETLYDKKDTSIYLGYIK